jgi:hypothetical protein
MRTAHRTNTNSNSSKFNDGSTGLVFVVSEYGMIGDEGTAASMMCRDYRHFAIGSRGGVKLITFAGNLRTTSPKNVTGIFKSVIYYHPQRKGKA